MKYNQIGGTGIRVSEIGLGCWTLGGLSWENGRSSGWTPVTRSAAHNAVGYALQCGVNHFDTAYSYGDGAAERLLAESLGAHSHDVIIASKIGYSSAGKMTFTPANIRLQCERSLRNCARDCLDLYYFHHADFGPNDQMLDDAVETMHRLCEQGKIRCIGLSSWAQRDLVRLIPRMRPAVVQCPIHMMDYHFVATNSPLSRACDQFGTAVIGFSPLNHGILSGKYDSSKPPAFPDGDHRSGLHKFRAQFLARAEKGLSLLKERFDTARNPLVAVALRFALTHNHVAGVLVGFRNQTQVAQLLKAAGLHLSGPDLAFIRKAFSSHREAL